MTSLTDLVEQGKVTPHERGSSITWWAYIHAVSGEIKVKGWFPAEPGEMDDLRYAEEEMKQGNNFILLLLEKPFCSDGNEHLERAKELIFEQLERGGLRVRMDPARSPPYFLANKLVNVEIYDRFRNLDLD